MVDAFLDFKKKKEQLSNMQGILSVAVLRLKGIFLHRVYIVGSRRISFNTLGVVEVWIWFGGDLADSLTEEKLLLREEEYRKAPFSGIKYFHLDLRYFLSLKR